MIWRSTELMTLFDVLIIAIVGYALFVFLSTQRNENLRGSIQGTAAICLGLGIIGLFYGADFLTMHALPLFYSMEESMAVMHQLHLNYRWFVTLLGVSLLVLGLVRNHSAWAHVVLKAQETEKSLAQELANRKEAEQALRDRESQLRSIIDNMPAEVHLKDMDGRYVEVNRRFEAFFGLSAEDVKGKTPAQLYPEEPAETAMARDRFVRETEQVIEREERAALTSGDHSFLTCCFPVKDGAGRMVGTGAIITDITDRKRTEDALRQTEAFFRTTIDQMPAAVSLKKPDGRYIVVNQTFQDWFNPDRQEVDDKTVRDLVPADHAGDILALEQAVFDTRKPSTREMEIPLADGRRRKAFIHKFPLFDAAGSLWAIGTIETDTTDLRQAEARLYQSQKMEAVGQLTGGVAHDFNNLLAVIMGNAELLAGKLKGSHHLNRYTKAVMRAARQGSKLTQQLLAFSRRQPLRPRAVDLSAMVNEMTEMLSRTLGAAIKLEIRLAADLPPVLADPAQVETALLNLAINARDAMPHGGHLTIEVASFPTDTDPTTTDLPGNAGDFVMLSVRDTGVGMSSEVLDHVFEPFFTTKGPGDGSGLGLSMVYGFVKQSEGHVAIESEPGRGTVVKLCLPRAETPAPATQRPAEGPDPSGHGETVLVVEDDLEVLSLTVSLLENLGYKAVQAEDGESALARLARDPHFDLIITDVMLRGGISGAGVASEARRKDPGAKVLFMSGYAEAKCSCPELLDDGSDLLNKPFRKSDLAWKVHGLLRRDYAQVH